jgi:type II secretion system protein N
MNLPIQKLGLDLKINRAYLGDMALTNWQAGLKINGGQITVEPFQMMINGGQVKGNVQLNVGVPGYAYDVALLAQKIPVDPLATTFAQSAPGQYQGDIHGEVKIKGAGITDANIQRNLAGLVDFSLTNANVALLTPRARFFLAPVAVLLKVPELLDSPLDAISLHSQVNQGVVEVQPFSAYGQAFRADCRGTITLAPVRTNSALNLPVTLLLKQAIAQKANLLFEKPATNAEYAALPGFVKIGGTLGAPKTDIDPLAAARFGIRTVGNLPFVNNKMTNALQGAEGLLSGDKSAITNTIKQLLPSLIGSNKVATPILQGTSSATNTNAAPGLNPQIGGLLQGIGNLMSKPQSTQTNKAKP